MAMDHDRLSKTLLTVFFADFLDLFLPHVAAELDRSSIHFLYKEVFTDVVAGDRHEVDLLAKVRLRGREACILVHVENQSSHRADFPRRMFQYYARLDARSACRSPSSRTTARSLRHPTSTRPTCSACRFSGSSSTRSS